MAAECCAAHCAEGSAPIRPRQLSMRSASLFETSFSAWCYSTHHVSVIWGELQARSKSCCCCVPFPHRQLCASKPAINGEARYHVRCRLQLDIMPRRHEECVQRLALFEVRRCDSQVSTVCVRRTASRDVHDGGGLVHAKVAKGKEALPRTLSMHEILVREVTDIYALLSPPQIDFRTSPGVEGPKAVLAQQLVVCKSRLCCAEIVMKAKQPRQQLPMQRMQLT